MRKEKASVAGGSTEDQTRARTLAPTTPETQRPLVVSVGGQNVEVDVEAVLSVAPADHPGQVARVSLLHQTALHEERRLETELEVWTARNACAIRLNSGTERLTEKRVEHRVAADAEYLRLKTAHNDASYRRGLLWAILSALTVRTSILSRASGVGL